MDRNFTSLNPLPEEYKNVISVAALFEGDISIDWLVDLIQIKPSKVLQAVKRGIQEGVLNRKGSGIFCFKDLKEKLRYGKSLASDKERWHRKIAGLLREEFPDREDKAKILAGHLLHCFNDEDGCEWLIKAGDLSRNSFTIDEALKYYAKALQDLSKLKGKKADLLFAEGAIKYSKISTATIETSKVVKILQEARIKAIRWNDLKLQIQLEIQLSKVRLLRSEDHLAQESFQQGRSLATSSNNSNLLKSVDNYHSLFLAWQGRYSEAVLNYEKSMPDIDRHPQTRLSTLTALTMIHCYAKIGMVTQSLGMLDTLRKHCQEKGDLFSLAHLGIAMGGVMLEIRRTDEAVHFLDESIKMAREKHNEWIRIMGMLAISFAYYLKGDHKRCLQFLCKHLDHSKRIQMAMQIEPFLMELCWAMEEGKLDSCYGLSLEDEINRNIDGHNVFLKGVAYRFRALLKAHKGFPLEQIIQDLQLSIEFLEESGGQTEVALSQLELVRQYLLLGEDEKAKDLTLKASNTLSPFHEALIPDDLQPFITSLSINKDRDLLKEILKLGQEVVAIRDNGDLVQHILSTGNRITGAERGAIFLFGENPSSPKLHLRASKNITPQDISHPCFSPSLKIIEQVTSTGKGVISQTKMDPPNPLNHDTIRSRISVPMVLKGRVVGALYHDNRLLDSLFKDSDLELLAYFASQAAFALDNAKAYEEIQRLNRKLSQEKMYYEEQHLQSLHFEDIIGESPTIMKVLAQADKVARTETTVLIRGETGVGKEVVARAIHRNSPRGDKPFIRVLCNALSDSLLPSELFGHEKGAFTGATSQRLGRFELADGGTIFLDEIGDLPLEIQVKLLRVLQTKEFERVGGTETIRSDFRLIAATNKNLEKEIESQRFRADLYYRISVFPIHVPPLRERLQDIPLLANYFLRIYTAKMGKSLVIPETEMEKLRCYNWPGNVRELENIIERGTILSGGAYFQVPELLTPSSTLDDSAAENTLRDNERKHILWALHKTDWKIRGRGGASEVLAIPHSTLAYRMKKLGIQRPEGIPKKRTLL